MRKWICIPLALLTMHVHAADEIPAVEVKPVFESVGLGQIDQIFRDKAKATVRFNEGQAVPDWVSVETAPGEACETKVDRVMERLAILDFAGCPGFDAVKAGAPVKASPLVVVAPPAPVATAPVVAAAAPSRMGVDVSIGLAPAAEMRFDSVDFVNSGTALSGSDLYMLGATGQFSLGLTSATEHRWGFQGALTIQGKRDVKFERVEVGSGTYTNSATGATMQFTLLEANALYRWNFMYVPFGLNYAIPNIKLPAGTSTSVNATGRIGAQLGIGFFLNDHIHLELLGQTIATNLQLSTPTTSVDLGNGYLSGLTVKLGYLF